MKLAFTLVSLLTLVAPAGATPPRCENDALMRSLGRLAGGTMVKVVKEPGETRLELVHGPARETILRATCDLVEAPLADHLDRPTKEASTRVVDGITVSRTARGAVSLELPAGLGDREALSLVLLDDDSVSIARGDKVFYAFATLPDGTTVETEGIGNGCGCERTTSPDGKVQSRRLPR